MSAPKEPKISCPYLDSAIAEIEKAREIHFELRNWGQYWKDEHQELDRTSSNEIERLKEEVKALEDEIFDLKKEIGDSQ